MKRESPKFERIPTMKFGFESEKLLFDLNDNNIYHGVFHLVDALSDYISFHGTDATARITNEFVLNMVEMNTIASRSQREVIEDYLLLYQIVKDVSQRENVAPLPLSAVPFHFTPSMVPKWPYYVQNSILSGKRLKEWALLETSPLADAGNCAGLHVHFEIEALPEFLMFSPELAHKHNLALMLTPMTAFAASPYFLAEHSAHSMRCKRYHFGVYKNFPHNGGLPPVFDTSENVLRYTVSGIDSWIARGMALGFSEDDLRKLTSKKGANWSMVRWNRTWNTIELRCLESDRIDLDLGKFVWAAGAMQRLDRKGEALIPVVNRPLAPLDDAMVDEAFTVTGNTVSIPSTIGIHELTDRAVRLGLGDPWVERYLQRLGEFALKGVEEDCVRAFQILKDALDRRETTSSRFLAESKGEATITQEACLPILQKLFEEDRQALARLRSIFPGAFPKGRAGIFPSFTRK
jgi:hypothetical protein